MASLSPEQVTAANEMAAAAVEALRTEQGVHAETAVAAAARMAGTFLFRSFGFKFPDVKPGQPVLSEAANEKGPQLLQALVGVLGGLGVELDRERLKAEPGPDHKPLLPFLETQKRVEPPCEAIRNRLGLSLQDAAMAAAAATAVVIRRTVKVLDPSVAFHIAAYGFVEGTKTAPAGPGGR